LGRPSGEKPDIRPGDATEYVVIVPQSVVVAVQPGLGRLVKRLAGPNTAYPHWQSGVLGPRCRHVHCCICEPPPGRSPSGHLEERLNRR